ncbi:hypothetical protein [Mycobacterium sp. URHB0021]
MPGPAEIAAAVSIVISIDFTALSSFFFGILDCRFVAREFVGVDEKPGKEADDRRLPVGVVSYSSNELVARLSGTADMAVPL